MNKIWLKIGVAALSVIGALVAMGGEALAWGPVIHQKIVAEARDKMEQGEIKGLWVAYPRYTYGGAIAPDWCLAYATVESGAWMLKKLPPTRVISIASSSLRQ